MLGSDATGKWSGHILLDEGGGNIKRTPLVVVLKVEGSAITGTAGPDEANQQPITSSEAPGEWLTFAVNSQTRFDLLIKGDKATGYVATEGQPREIRTYATVG